jgi:hypothetical protein
LNRLELKEANQQYVIYLYYPEDNGTFGEIRMNIGDEDAVVISHSSDDGAGRYAFKATKAVKECVKERNFPLEWHGFKPYTSTPLRGALFHLFKYQSA